MSDAPPRRLPRRPRDQAREAAILNAAAEVLAEVGYDRLTFQAVDQDDATQVLLSAPAGRRLDNAHSVRMEAVLNEGPGPDRSGMPASP